MIQPRLPSHPVRAVHVTAYAWADPTLRQGVLELIDQGRINAVELDLKDEAGDVGCDRAVPLAHADRRRPATIYDLRQAVALAARAGRARDRPARLLPRPDPRAAAWRRGSATR